MGLRHGASSATSMRDLRTIRERRFIEEMCNREFLHKDPDQALKYLSDLVERSNTWSGPSATNGTNRSRKTGVYHLGEETNLKAEIENLTKQIEAFKSQGGRGIDVAAKVETYDN